MLLLLIPSLLAAAQDTTGTGSLRGRSLTERGEAARVQEVFLLKLRCQVADLTLGCRFPGLRPGEYELAISGHNVAMKVWPGLEAEVEIVLSAPAPLRHSIEVSEPIFLAPVEVKTSRYVIAAQEINASPAALKDISRYVQTLPGVLFGTNEFRNGLIVGGGSPLANLSIVDNFEIPNINHFTNFASAGAPVGQINMELLSDMTFLSLSYPAPYANRLSSGLQLRAGDG